jgi:zinc protease
MQSKRFLLTSLALLCAVPVAFAAEKRPTNAIEVPYTKYVLSNGLTLIVHEDHKAPIVALDEPEFRFAESKAIDSFAA